MGIGKHLGNVMRSRLFHLLPLLLLPSLAAAFSTTSSGNQTTYGGFNAGQTNIGRYAVSTASDGTVLVNSGGRLNVPGGGSIPINVTGSIPKPSAAAAVGRFLLKGSGVIGVLGVGVAAYELAQELGYTLDNSSGSTTATYIDPSACTVGPCYAYRFPANSGPVRSGPLVAACQAYVASLVNPPYTFAYDSVVGDNLCYYRYSGGGFNNVLGFTEGSRTQVAPVTSGSPATLQQLQDAIAAKSGWPTDSKLAATVRDALLAGDALAVESPVVTGPATAPVSTTTTVDPATGNTTTTVVQISNTYSGPTVTTTTTQTTTVTNTSTGAPVGQPTTTTVATPVTPTTESPSEPAPFAMPCGVAGTPPCGVKVDEADTPSEVSEDEFKPLLDEGRQAQEDLLDTVSGDADKSSLFDGFADLFVTPALAECVPLEIPGDRGSIDPCGTVGGARAIMAYIWALSGLALCLHMVRKAL